MLHEEICCSFLLFCHACFCSSAFCHGTDKAPITGTFSVLGEISFRKFIVAQIEDIFLPFYKMYLSAKYHGFWWIK